MNMSNQDIQLDYSQAIQQASKLKEIEQDLARYYKKVQVAKDTMADGWQDDAQRYIIQYIDDYARAIDFLKITITQIADAIEKTANVYLRSNKTSNAPVITPISPGRPL